MFPTFGMEILERKFLILQLSSESISIRNEKFCSYEPIEGQAVHVIKANLFLPLIVQIDYLFAFIFTINENFIPIPVKFYHNFLNPSMANRNASMNFSNKCNSTVKKRKIIIKK